LLLGVAALYTVIINIIVDIKFVIVPFPLFLGSKSSTKDEDAAEKILYKRVAA